VKTLYKSRQADTASLTTTISTLQSTQTTFAHQFSSSIVKLTEDVSKNEAKTEKSLHKATEAQKEYDKVMRLMRVGEQLREKDAMAEALRLSKEVV
jgi:hypothetical protein